MHGAHEPQMKGLSRTTDRRYVHVVHEVWVGLVALAAADLRGSGYAVLRLRAGFAGASASASDALAASMPLPALP